MTSLLDEAALLEASSPYVVASLMRLNEADSHNGAPKINEVDPLNEAVLLEASLHYVVASLGEAASHNEAASFD